MGYHTCFMLEVKASSEYTFKELDTAIEKMNNVLEAISGSGDFMWQNSGPPITWYDHEEDMVKLSQQFPSLVFVLSGIGDSAEDMWKKYFSNGLIQRTWAKITYDEFDKSKLRPLGEEKTEVGNEM